MKPRPFLFALFAVAGLLAGFTLGRFIIVRDWAAFGMTVVWGYGAMEFAAWRERRKWEAKFAALEASLHVALMQSAGYRGGPCPACGRTHWETGGEECDEAPKN